MKIYKRGHLLESDARSAHMCFKIQDILDSKGFANEYNAIYIDGAVVIYSDRNTFRRIGRILDESGYAWDYDFSDGEETILVWS